MLGAPSCRHSPHSYHYLGATGPFSESFDSHGSETDPPHGGVRTFHQKSTCLTQLTFGPYVVQIWSGDPQKFEATKPFLELHRVEAGSRGLVFNTVSHCRTNSPRRRCGWGFGGHTMEYEGFGTLKGVGGRDEIYTR